MKIINVKIIDKHAIIINEYCSKYDVDRKTVLQFPYWQENEDNYTFAMYLALNGIIPPKEFKHKYDLQSNEGFMVQNYLLQNNIKKEGWWNLYKKNNKNQQIEQLLNQYCQENKTTQNQIINYPAYQNNNLHQTFAMYLACQKILPPLQFKHNPQILNNGGWTVAAYLEKNGITAPKEWEYNNIIRLEDNYTTAMLIAESGNIPSKHWQHDPNIKGGCDNQTVREYLQQNQLPIPNEWYDDEYKKNYDYKPNYVNDAIYGKISYNLIKKAQQQNKQYEYGWTIAMMLANKGVVPPQQIIHNPSLQNYQGDTVAMLLAKNNIIPPKQWEHEPNIQNNIGNTVAVYLEINDIETPKQWQYDPLYKLQGNYSPITTALRLAEKGVIPSSCWYHDPLLTNDTWKGTVALLLAYNGIQPPIEWKHDKYLVDSFEQTVQQYLQKRNIQVPEYWKY